MTDFSAKSSFHCTLHAQANIYLHSLLIDVFPLQVLPKHVKEAYRLLNKSIIRVDQPDIHFDEEEEEEEEINGGAENGDMETNDDNAATPAPQSQGE